MQIDNQIASHRWRLRRANSYHIPDGTPTTDKDSLFVGGKLTNWGFDPIRVSRIAKLCGNDPILTIAKGCTKRPRRRCASEKTMR